MLTIEIPETELYDEKTGGFIYCKACKLNLEHSLVSLSKWESKHQTPFLNNKQKTEDEILDYIKFMTVDHGVSDSVYKCLTSSNLEDIRNYIDSPMTATTFRKTEERPSREIVTSELIYYWMIESGIPFECQKWHLNRLLTLIKVCMIKNTPAKKMPMADILKQNASLNKARRAALNSKG